MNNWTREKAAQAGTVLAGLLILILSKTLVMRQEIPPPGEPISLTLLAPPVEPQIKPEIKTEIKPEKILEKPVQMAKTLKSVEIPAAINVTATPSTVPQAVKPAVAAVMAAEVVAPVKTVAPDIEAAFVAKIRAYLNSAKRYPTGREASLSRPSGRARVWFVLRRSGELVDAGIETGSGSMLLDAAALTTVRRASYTAIPDEAWSGQTQHQFSVELDFVPPPT